MAQTIKIPNYNSPNIRETTFLRDDAAAGLTTLDVENSTGFLAPQQALIGEIGAEDSEILTLLNPADIQHLSVTVATKFKHLEYTPVRLLFGTTLKLYRAPNTDGTAPTVDKFTLLDTVVIDTDDLTTVYTDESGGAQYWYRFTYQGPSGESNLEDCPAVRGGNAGLYCSYDEVRQASGFENAKFITDQMIAVHLAAAQALIDSALQGKYVVPFSDPINPQIAQIAKTLAAGYLMVEQYPSNPDRGQNKIDSATKDLMNIQGGGVVLLNTAGVVQADETSILGEHWPNETTPDTPRDEGGSTRYFRMDDVRNDYDRRY